MTVDGLLYDLSEKQVYHIGKQILLALVSWAKGQQMTEIFLVSLGFDVAFCIFIFQSGTYIILKIRWKLRGRNSSTDELFSVL